MSNTVDNSFSAGATPQAFTTLADMSVDDLIDWGRSDPLSTAFWSTISIPKSAYQMAVTDDTLLALADLRPTNADTSGFCTAPGLKNSGATTNSPNIAAGTLTGTAADWKGDEAIGVGRLTDSIPTANDKMYAQLGTELDAVFGKGQYVKPTNHYEYVKLVGQAMKQLSPEQQITFKNRLEQIGQPLHINFGLTRTRHEGSNAYGVPLNSYAQNGFSSAQQTEEMRLKKEFFDERDRATGRSK